MVSEQLLAVTVDVTEAQALVDESLALRRYLRRHAYLKESIYDPRYAPPMRGFWARVPVRVVPGDGEPRYAGEPWHYETWGGKLIRNPSAYSRKGWSSMVYRPSTRRVEVGAGYIQRVCTGKE
jgi:hypothetical protein